MSEESSTELIQEQHRYGRSDSTCGELIRSFAALAVLVAMQVCLCAMTGAAVLETVAEGFDPGPEGVRSTILDRYRTGGTPWMVLIDREGTVRYNAISIGPDCASRLIREMLAEREPGSHTESDITP